MTQLEFTLVAANVHREEWYRVDSFSLNFIFRVTLPTGSEALKWSGAGIV